MNKNRKLLYIDDSYADYVILSHSLKQPVVDYMDNYKAGDDVEDEYDMVVIDVNFPDNNGYEIYSMLKHKLNARFVITSALTPHVSIEGNDNLTVVGKNKLIDYLKRWAGEYG